MYLTKIAQKVWAEYYDPYANDQDWGCIIISWCKRDKENLKPTQKEVDIFLLCGFFRLIFLDLSLMF